MTNVCLCWVDKWRGTIMLWKVVDLNNSFLVAEARDGIYSLSEFDSSFQVVQLTTLVYVGLILRLCTLFWKPSKACIEFVAKLMEVQWRVDLIPSKKRRLGNYICLHSQALVQWATDSHRIQLLKTSLYLVSYKNITLWVILLAPLWFKWHLSSSTLW
jgi:hypothetical protein